MRSVFVVVMMSACTPWTELPDVPGPGQVAAVTPGVYAGEATLEVRAFAGPLLVKRELCSVPIDITVDTSAGPLLEGEFTCVFESTGEVSADFVGDDDGLPLISGMLEARSLEAMWDGWFIDSTSLYADMEGRDNQDGLRIEYLGFVEAERTGPVPGSSLGG